MGACISVCEASLLRADSCFFVDNGSIENRVSGLGGAVGNADSVYINNSNIYYNTLYSEGYWTNACSLANDLRGCFWMTDDTTEIRGFLDGPNEFWPIAYDFIPGAPGEPYTIIDIEAYAEDDFETPVDIVDHIGDTLWLEVIGQDRSQHFYEACVLRIRSEGSEGDIAVALAETDSCSGIYRGRVVIVQATESDTIWRDDVWNRIRVNPTGDTMRFYSVIDTTAYKDVSYVSMDVAETPIKPKGTSLGLSPNPFNSTLAIDAPDNADITIHDTQGRIIVDLGTSRFWNAEDDVASGVYLVRAQMGDKVVYGRAVLIR